MTKPLDTSPHAIRKFGVLFCGVTMLIAVILFWRGKGGWPWFAGASAFFLGTGLFLRVVLRPVYIVWMKFAFLLGWVNTRVFLGGFFYLVLTPTGLLLRLFGKDVLDEKIDRAATSYWIKRDAVPFDPHRTERMF